MIPSLSLKTAILEELKVSQEGLSSKDLEALRQTHGFNELPLKSRSLFKLFLGQFNNFMVYILLGAVVLSIGGAWLLKGAVEKTEMIDSIVILAIIFLNAILSFFQEKKAENAIALLRKLSAPNAKVRRDGLIRFIPSREVLPRDVMLIETGDKLSADGVILESSSLEVNESSLTGESVPAAKVAPLPSRNNDNSNKIFSGTAVTRGSAEVLVTAIALQTEIGKVTSLVAETETPPTPLQLNLEKTGHKIGIGVLALCAILFVIGLAKGLDLLTMLFTAISLAVAAVPEGLPAIVTICLALGVKQMIRHRALIRKLDAIETLGSVSVICADKTGTITENDMKVTELWTLDNDSKNLLVLAAASCNRAVLPNFGDPTELALLKSAEQEKITPLPIIEEKVPFTSEGKYMVTRHEREGASTLFYKGAPEVIATFCNEADRKLILVQNERMTRKGLRILAVARESESEKGKVKFLGLIGLLDAPRAGVREAIALARNAGIRTMMITGDNPLTAEAIALQVGIITKGVMTGVELDKLDEAVLRQKVQTVSVFARVQPIHKVAILEALQKNSEIVAMSGDGVNDAPALKRAHVGIAMGFKGTDVAREAAAMVLTDDNYSTIVEAIAEGRRIYDNIRKFILFLFRCNAGEIGIIAVALLVGMPLPLLPLHILWMNLVTDSAPALALAAEKAEPNIMSRPPRAKNQHFLSGEGVFLVIAAILNTVATLGVFIIADRLSAGVGDPLLFARSAALTATILFQIFLSFSSRSSLSIFRQSPFSNPWLLGAGVLSLGLHLLLLSTPLAPLFSVTMPPLALWGYIIGAPLLAIFIFEGAKIFQKKSLSFRRPDYPSSDIVQVQSQNFKLRK
ncbi:cation-translocating P-type ATPase [Candidatus Peregrinibacteria bacterium]|nr:cation-translocating P-type ATPase [Candidatus Peregrinibacteria bacterium]